MGLRGFAAPRPSKTSPRSCIWSGTRSRSSSSSTCASSCGAPERPGRRSSASTRCRSGKGTPIGSSSMIWFAGTDRSEASLDEFFTWLGAKKTAGIRLAVMDMWKPFRTSTTTHAPQASILFDKFHVLRHLGDALDTVRKSEYARLAGKDRRFIKGQKYTLLAHRENLTLEGKKSLKLLLTANKRLNTAYLLKESFGQLWDYGREGWARRFFENWRASLKWQRLKPFERFAAMIERIGRGSRPTASPRTRWRSASSRD